jgi:hypothetical protein
MSIYPELENNVGMDQFYVVLHVHSNSLGYFAKLELQLNGLEEVAIVCTALPG